MHIQIGIKILVTGNYIVIHLTSICMSTPVSSPIWKQQSVVHWSKQGLSTSKTSKSNVTCQALHYTGRVDTDFLKVITCPGYLSSYIHRSSLPDFKWFCNHRCFWKVHKNQMKMLSAKQGHHCDVMSILGTLQASKYSMLFLLTK